MGGASAVVSGAISQTDSGAMFTEISDVLSGLNQFKTELLELHAAVCVCSVYVCVYSVCVCVCVCV